MEINCDVKGIVDHLPTVRNMAATIRVQLAVYDGPCPSQRLSPYDNKIGGYPDFFPNCALSTPPSCKSCGGPLALLAQVYCPHEGSPFHRLLHVYCCCQSICWPKSECWLVLRSQMKDPSYDEPEEEAKLSVAKQEDKWTATREWCEDVDDWGHGPRNVDEWESGCGERELISQPTGTSFKYTPEIEVECLMKAMSVAETSNETFPVNTVTIPSYEGPYYPAGFMSVVEDLGACTAGAVKVEKLLKKYKNDHPNCYLTMDGLVIQQDREKGSEHHKGGKREKAVSCGAVVNSEGEVYEKGVARHGDETFQKFHKQLLKFPQQILRYSWRGKPLLFTSNPAHLPPKDYELDCKECGAPRVYEFQLMPPLVYILQQNQKRRQAVLKDQGVPQSQGRIVEFGTVLIYTCSNSCWENSLTRDPQFKEEIVVVQPDFDTIDKF